jgi:hypothetical protein
MKGDINMLRAKEQEALFNDTKNINYDIMNIVGEIQNNFETLMSDGFLTKEDIVDIRDNTRKKFRNLESKLSDIEKRYELLFSKLWLN